MTAATCYEGIRAVCDVEMIAAAETADQPTLAPLLIAVGLGALALFLLHLKGIE